MEKCNMNECRHSPSGKHECIHQHYCIFNSNRAELENKIINLQKKIDEFKHIKHCFINGEIIYHDELAEYYQFDTTSYVGADNNIHFKIGVTVKDGFIGAINHKIKVLGYDLKNLEKFRLDVLHGKIGGYGYD